MLGVPRIGDSLDVFEFLPVNERQKYRHAKVVDVWWEPNKERTLIPRIIVEYGPLSKKPERPLPEAHELTRPSTKPGISGIKKKAKPD